MEKRPVLDKNYGNRTLKGAVGFLAIAATFGCRPEQLPGETCLALSDVASLAREGDASHSQVALVNEQFYNSLPEVSSDDDSTGEFAESDQAIQDVSLAAENWADILWDYENGQATAKEAENAAAYALAVSQTVTEKYCWFEPPRQ